MTRTSLVLVGDSSSVPPFYFLLDWKRLNPSVFLHPLAGSGSAQGLRCLMFCPLHAALQWNPIQFISGMDRRGEGVRALPS